MFYLGLLACSIWQYCSHLCSDLIRQMLSLCVATCRIRMHQIYNLRNPKKNKYAKIKAAVQGLRQQKYISCEIPKKQVCQDKRLPSRVCDSRIQFLQLLQFFLHFLFLFNLWENSPHETALADDNLRHFKASRLYIHHYFGLPYV